MAERESTNAGELKSPDSEPLPRDHALPKPYANCTNCGSALIGPYCWHCGQPTRHLIRFFPALIAETLEGLFDVDSRLHRTMVPLMFRPGRLTVDYIEGRRARYVPPLRLYLFTSIIFFVVLALTTDVNVSNEPLTQEERAELVEEIDAARERLAQGEGASPDAAAEGERQRRAEQLDTLRDRLASGEPLTPAEAAASAAAADDDNDFVIRFSDDEEWDPRTDPVDIGWLPEWLNQALTREAIELEAKVDRIEENPQLIVDEFFGVLPQVIFVLVPLFALILKLLYLLRKRYYMEHLILALYSHSFLFMSMLIMVLLGEGVDWIHGLSESVGEVMSVIGTGIMIALWVWIPVYLFIAQKRMYGQGWWMTSFKYFLTGVLYLALLSIGTVSAAVLGMVMMS